MMVGLKRISGKVGGGATNSSSDVKTVQTLLNKFTSQAGFSKLKEDGAFGPRTEAALQAFQRKVMNASSPKKVIEPGGDVLKHLNARIRDLKNLSGKKWFDNNQSKYPTSKEPSKLKLGFRGKVNSFIKALKDAGATVTVTVTSRDKKRAEVMNRAWRVMKGQLDPTCVPPIPGVAIEWDHGDKDRSKAAARELAQAFRIHTNSLAPSPNSRHVAGEAIDMDIKWSGDLHIKDAKGKIVVIKSGDRNGTNRDLHKVGASYETWRLQLTWPGPPPEDIGWLGFTLPGRRPIRLHNGWVGIDLDRDGDLEIFFICQAFEGMDAFLGDPRRERDQQLWYANYYDGIEVESPDCEDWCNC
jgi:hypothetical protein